MLTTLLLNLVITLTPQNVVPTLKTLGNGKYAIVNPLKANIVVYLNCGSNYKQPEVSVGANHTETVEVVDPDGGSVTCWIDNYKVGKTKRR
jgi:hypothetical protein